MWIAQCNFEQSKLFLGRFNRLRIQCDRNNGMFGSKVLQMRLEHAKEKIDIIGRLRNFENPLVCLLISERDLQRQFFCYQINPGQPQRELLQKTAEHKKERLGCFDFVLELKAFLEQ